MSVFFIKTKVPLSELKHLPGCEHLGVDIDFLVSSKATGP